MTISLKRILVCIDFSDPSQAALRYAKEFSQVLKATLHILHVSDDPVLRSPTTAENFRHDLEVKCRQDIEQLLNDVGIDKEEVEILVLSGSPSLEIVNYVKEQKIDLIVMGSDGLSAIAHMLLGSVADKVLRMAPCPVLTVRSPTRDE